jgi:hypothetical protein
MLVGLATESSGRATSFRRGSRSYRWASPDFVRAPSPNFVRAPSRCDVITIVARSRSYRRAFIKFCKGTFTRSCKSTFTQFCKSIFQVRNNYTNDLTIAAGMLLLRLVETIIAAGSRSYRWLSSNIVRAPSPDFVGAPSRCDM